MLRWTLLWCGLCVGLGSVGFAAAEECRLGLPGSGGRRDPVLVQVGHRLFFDRALSLDGTISCATCHDPDHAFADPRPTSTGVHGRNGRRNSPTILNAGYLDVFGWDGKAKTLEHVILQALRDSDEMAVNEQRAVKAIERAGSPVRNGDNAMDRIATALAEFVRSLASGNSAADRYLFAQDMNTLSEASKRGLELFFGKAHCSVCHTVRHRVSHPFGGQSALYTDQRFHNLGLEPLAVADAGHEHISGQKDDRGRFRTPTLRNVSKTAPYMHDGRFKTLDEVVEFYSRGGGPGANKDPVLRPLHLTEAERRDLVSFLLSLDGQTCGQAVTANTLK
jgi:cytochrome c peroxidase